MVRSKKDIISTWLNIIKVINSYTYESSKELQGKNYIYILKNSSVQRVFIALDNKITSLNFPFKITLIKEDVRKVNVSLPHSDIIVDNNICDIVDRYILSPLDDIQEISLEFFKEDFIGYNSLRGDSNILDEAEERIWVSACSVFSCLVLRDSGYIRYDYDPDKESEIHPINHFDIFYSNLSSFKIGTSKKLDLDLFIDVLDKETPTYFIK